MIIPAVKLVRAGEIEPDLFRLVLAQIRSKRETAGDLRAQIAANNTGIRRVNDWSPASGRRQWRSTPAS